MFQPARARASKSNPINKRGKLGSYILSHCHLWCLWCLQQHICLQQLPHCCSDLDNTRPVVPGRRIALRQAWASLLEVVRMWLRRQRDLREEEESVKVVQLLESAHCWNDAFKDCRFPLSNYKTILLVVVEVNTFTDPNKEFFSQIWMVSRFLVLVLPSSWTWRHCSGRHCSVHLWQCSWKSSDLESHETRRIS